MTTDEWRAVWVAVLDELAADVSSVEATLNDERRRRELPPANPWSPPPGIGPLPLDLRPRADAILARQLVAARELATVMATNRRQAAFAARVEAGQSGQAPPFYVDCAL